MYYEDYYDTYGISEEDLKTDFHIVLDKVIDAEVEKRLESRIKDIDTLRENQKQYDEKIAEANNKVKEAENKRLEADRARMSAERERDNTIKQCEQSISDAAQQKLDEMFGHWLNESYAYYLHKDKSYVYCPYCNNGQVEIKLPNGDKATTKCKVCGGNSRVEYVYYEKSSITTEYPTFIKENQGKTLAPYFVRPGRYYGIEKVALRDVMTREEAEEKAKTRNEDNKRNALKRLEERKKKLDEENTR
jgi:transposase-like protein